MSGGGSSCDCTGGIGISHVIWSYPLANQITWTARCEKLSPVCAGHTLLTTVRCCRVE